jgi:two-component system, OmpR family, sensor histidine kinase KdpD
MSPLSPENPAPILVALGSEARTLRLVHAGFHMAKEQSRPWIAVHVEVPGWETAGEADQARVWLQEARELGAEVAWVKSSTVINGLLSELKRTSATVLVAGQNRGTGLLARLEHANTQELLRSRADLRIVALSLDAPPTSRGQVRTLTDAIGVLAATMVLLIVCTIAASATAVVAGYPAIPIAFSAAVAFITHRWGRRAAIPAIALSILIYLYLFAEPRFNFTFTDWPKLLYFLGTLALVQMLVDLVDRLRLETRTSRRREAETVLLMLLGRALARCSTIEEAADVLSKRSRSLYQSEARLLIPDQGDRWIRIPESETAIPPPSALLPHFGPTSDREDPMEPLFQDGCNFVALASTRGTEGLLEIRLPGEIPFPQESWGSLQAFAVQGALALERIRWLEAAQQAHVERETERMRSSLLSAISHDLRTPLAAIQGAASSLLLPAEPLPESTRKDMLAMIHDESERLAVLLSNLLDLTRLESGVIRARKEWQPLDEVIGAVLRRMEPGMDVRVHLPQDLPLVPLDAVLVEQLLANLLINARRHAPDCPVELRAWTGPEILELEISDQGPGIPEAFKARVFDKFFRMPDAAGDGGVGLGLAICEAIVKTHGGRIWVEDSPAGGASFRITLPMNGKPPTLPPET